MIKKSIPWLEITKLIRENDYILWLAEYDRIVVDHLAENRYPNYD